MADIKAFDRWSTEGIKIVDPGLERYVILKPRIMPRSGAEYAGNKFHKSRVFIIERLMNKIMMPGHKGKKHKHSSGHCTGKALNAYKVVEEMLSFIEKKTNDNPIKVFVKALENAAPREELVTIEYGGARYPKAVECAPQRRVDFTLRQMTEGAYQKSFNSKKTIVQALAEEIMNAATLSPNSNAIAKKLEIERQADASR